MDRPPLIYDYSADELNEILTGWGEERFRVRQVWEGLYRKLWQNPQDNLQGGGRAWSNLSRGLQARLGEAFAFNHLFAVRSLRSGDGETEKTLFRLPDGAEIESVLMRYHPHADEKNQYTLCVSSQAGCAMRCQFCATGQMGFLRNLTPGEIVEQVLHYARHLASGGETLTHVVVMGMGEPFLNYENTLKAIDILNNEDGFQMGQRRFTISTVGIIPQIYRFAEEKRQINLAVSLHAADDELRSRLLPINQKFPLKALQEACRAYIGATNRRLTFEWALIEGVNDTPEQAQKLAALLRGMLCHVNLIPLNPTERYKGRGSQVKNARAFQAALEAQGIPCTLRLRRGIDIQAGCGQLIAMRSAGEADGTRVG